MKRLLQDSQTLWAGLWQTSTPQGRWQCTLTDRCCSSGRMRLWDKTFLLTKQRVGLFACLFAFVVFFLFIFQSGTFSSCDLPYNGPTAHKYLHTAFSIRTHVMQHRLSPVQPQGQEQSDILGFLMHGTVPGCVCVWNPFPGSRNRDTHPRFLLSR